MDIKRNSGTDLPEALEELVRPLRGAGASNFLVLRLTKNDTPKQQYDLGHAGELGHILRLMSHLVEPAAFKLSPAKINQKKPVWTLDFPIEWIAADGRPIAASPKCTFKIYGKYAGADFGDVSVSLAGEARLSGLRLSGTESTASAALAAILSPSDREETPRWMVLGATEDGRALGRAFAGSSESSATLASSFGADAPKLKSISDFRAFPVDNAGAEPTQALVESNPFEEALWVLIKEHLQTASDVDTATLSKNLGESFARASKGRDWASGLQDITFAVEVDGSDGREFEREVPFAPATGFFSSDRHFSNPVQRIALIKELSTSEFEVRANKLTPEADTVTVQVAEPELQFELSHRGTGDAIVGWRAMGPAEYRTYGARSLADGFLGVEYKVSTAPLGERLQFIRIQLDTSGHETNVNVSCYLEPDANAFFAYLKNGEIAYKVILPDDPHGDVESKFLIPDPALKGGTLFAKVTSFERTL